MKTLLQAEGNEADVEGVIFQSTPWSDFKQLRSNMRRYRAMLMEWK